MKAFVFWTGIYNFVAGLSLFFPALHSFLGIAVPESVVWGELIGMLVVLLGVILIVCSRNLQTRAPIVYWDGIGRIVVFVLLGWFGFFGGIGVMLGVFGLIDLAIGLVYIFGLPKTLGRGHGQLMWDRA